MPELPEVESARRVLVHALDREIAAVDDTDHWVCRPHAPGEIAAALVGGRLTAAHRKGKSMWCETAGRDGAPGPHLGIHLGMGGRLIVGEQGGGEPVRPDRTPRKAEWDRFTVVFSDGGRLRLFDKRRLGRVRLDPDLDALGPDAEMISRADFRARVRRGRSAVKARLLDQSVLAGVGNLLADEILWRAGLDPARRNPLSEEELRGLHRALRATLRQLARRGGSHTGDLMDARQPGGHCPIDGVALRRDVVGGRTTFWCPKHQH